MQPAPTHFASQTAPMRAPVNGAGTSDPTQSTSQRRWDICQSFHMEWENDTYRIRVCTRSTVDIRALASKQASLASDDSLHCTRASRMIRTCFRIV